MPMLDLSGEPEWKRREIARDMAKKTRVATVPEEEGGHHSKRRGGDYTRVLMMPSGRPLIAGKAATFGVSLVPVEDDETPIKDEFPGAEVLAMIVLARGDEAIFVDMSADEIRELGSSLLATAAHMDEGKAKLIDRCVNG